jgi:hypothetical protein
MLTIGLPKDTAPPENLEDLFLSVYFFIDELVKLAGGPPVRSGPKSRFSDSEALCVQVVGQFLALSEHQWHRFVAANCLHLFPSLLERSAFHKRCKDLAPFLLRLRALAVWRAGPGPAHVFDSMPVPVCHFARRRRNAAWAAALDGDGRSLYGYCAAKAEKFYGFRLHLAVRPDGLPADFILAPASRHDVEVAASLALSAHSRLVLGDKGYLGLEKRPEFRPSDPVPDVLTPKRSNQTERNRPWENALLRSVRSGVETVNSILVKIGTARHGAKSMRGLKSRIGAKLSCFTFAFLLNAEFVIKTCSIASLL